jgi:RNA polymerase sigma-70 factor, ECF subfamily
MTEEGASGRAGSSVAEADDRRLVDDLKARDEGAFVRLVDTYHASLVRVARAYVRTDAVAEEVVQETWLAVLQGIDRFEERSSLKTWLFRILVNRAKTKGQREARSVPVSSLEDEEGEGGPSVDPDRFLGDDHRWAGYWSAPPQPWEGVPDERLLSKERMDVVGAALRALPPRQQQVLVLRDVEGLGAGEVCDLLDLSEGNQRVLLHRARSSVRAALESDADV